MLRIEDEVTILDVVPTRAISRVVSLGMARQFGTKEFGQAVMGSLGCLYGALGPDFPPVVGAQTPACGDDEEAEECCKMLDAEMRAAGDHETDPAKFNPLVFSLLLQLFQFWMSRKQTA